MSIKKQALGPQTWLPLLSGLVGVALGGLISIATVERQIQVTQAAEQRQTRAEAYLALTDAASDYANSTRALLDAQPTRGAVTASDIAAVASDARVGAWLTSRHAFQEALNEVYIYGSTEGWAAALDLAGALPYSRGEDYEWVEVSPQFTDRYNAVLAVICEEATISARADCSPEE